MRGHVEKMPHALVGSACQEPGFGLRGHESADVALQRQEARAVVDQGLREIAVAERAEALGHAGLPVARSGTGHERGAGRIGQELGHEEIPREPPERELVSVRGQRHETVRGLVVLEVVVVVVDEVARRGAEHHAVEFRELRLDGGLDGRFVGRAAGGQAPVEGTHAGIPGTCGVAHVRPAGVELRALVPVEVVADRDRGVGREGQGPRQQSAPKRQGQERLLGCRGRRVGGIAAGARVGEQPHGRRVRVRGRIRPERPRIGQGLVRFVDELQPVLVVRLQAAHVEGEVAGLGVGGAGGDAHVRNA